MKITLKQQALILMLRDGWQIKMNSFGLNYVKDYGTKHHPNERFKKVDRNVFNSLFIKGVIKKTKSGTDVWKNGDLYSIFELTPEGNQIKF